MEVEMENRRNHLFFVYLIISVFLCLQGGNAAYGAYADALWWADGEDGGTLGIGTDKAYYQDGATPVTAGNAGMAIISPDATASPPTASAADSYLDATEKLTEDSAATLFMGYDEVYDQFFSGKDGQKGAVVYNSDDSGYGYLRAFSGTTITGSAYYGDSTPEALTDSGDRRNLPAGNVTCDTVNPAYTIPFVVEPYVDPTDDTYVIGQVEASGTGGNNRLSTSMLLLEYKPESGGSWTNIPVTFDTDGGFNVTFPMPAYFRARVKDADTPRPGLPLSGEYLLGPGELTTAPGDDFIAEGPHEGPFSPSSITYTLTNDGYTSIDWSASKSENWLDLSDPASGTLDPGEQAMLIVTINDNAEFLGVGLHTDTITITNDTNDNGSTTRGVELTVNEKPGALTVDPAEGLHASGDQGGPFTPDAESYSLYNGGSESIDWTATKTADWITLSPTGGSLSAGSGTSLSVSINSAADFLAKGTYSDTVTLTNTTNGNGNTTRTVTLSVNAAGGILTVTEAEGFTPSGEESGPFSPTSKTYTLENTSGSSINWSASSLEDWTGLSPTSGSIPGNGSDQLTVSLTADANTLSPDDYADSVIITNTTNGSGSTTRPVNLTVHPKAGVMSVTPGDGLTASGLTGGSFSPENKTYTIENTGGLPLDWSVTRGQAWLSLSSPSEGTLQADESTTVTVSFNSMTDTLGVGDYSDAVVFTNLTNGNGDTQVPVNLTVDPIPGELAVTPADEYAPSGNEGGPFNPASLDYTLKNIGGGSIDWTATKWQSWLTVSPASGTLAGGSEATVTVSLDDPTANALSAGTYSDTIVFKNTTNNKGNSLRSVTLTVRGLPGGIEVTPASDLDAGGMEGGPFSPTSIQYTVENTGGTAVDWSVLALEDWVTLSGTTGGTLNPGATQTVTAAINDNANALAPGDHVCALIFTNQTNGTGNTSRSVNLTVTPQPSMLTVTPDTGMAAYGVSGGPFTPNTKEYTLENTGGSALDWRIEHTETWLEFSTTSGNLGIGGSVIVTASLTTDADSLGGGDYADTVEFINDTDGNGSTSMLFNLFVEPTPGKLDVTGTETDVFTLKGVKGGPFSPASKIYTLTNTGGSPIQWTAGCPAGWVSISPTGGSLGPGEDTNVTISNTSEATGFDNSEYTAEVKFTNATNWDGNTYRGIKLIIGWPLGDVDHDNTVGMDNDVTVILQVLSGRPVTGIYTDTSVWDTGRITPGDLLFGVQSEGGNR
jgi:hypothetical protein